MKPPSPPLPPMEEGSTVILKPNCVVHIAVLPSPVERGRGRGIPSFTAERLVQYSVEGWPSGLWRRS